MIKLAHIPHGVDEIKETYGDPGDDLWARDNLGTFALPFPLRLSWDPGTLVYSVIAHRLVGGAIVDALDEIGQFKGGAYLERNKLNRFGGIYNRRAKRGIDQPSTHTWAIAIDLNPDKAPLGGDPNGQPRFIVGAFTKRGFVWGGNFARPDGMHFQACGGY